MHSLSHIKKNDLANIYTYNSLQAKRVELLLESIKKDILHLSQNFSQQDKQNFILSAKKIIVEKEYLIAGYISLIDNSHSLVSQHKGLSFELPLNSLDKVSPDPFLFYDKLRMMESGTIEISPLSEATYPLFLELQPSNKIKTHAWQMVTPSFTENTLTGFIIIMIDATQIKKILTKRLNKESSSLQYHNKQIVTASFFYTFEGLILPQPYNDNPYTIAPSMDAFFSSCNNTLIHSSYGKIFQVDRYCKPFKNILTRTKLKNNELLAFSDNENSSFGSSKEVNIALAPIFFMSSLESAPTVWSGLASLNMNNKALSTYNSYLFIITMLIATSFLMCFLMIYLLGRHAAKPIDRLTQAIVDIQKTGKLNLIKIPKSSYETSALQDAINNLIFTMKRQMDNIHIREMRLKTESLREPVDLDKSYKSLFESSSLNLLPEIQGLGKRMDTLRLEIFKAAKVDVDVLITGETGTGKQLTAEAIHSHSQRRDRSLISINCGELDSNLLMDTLFGHVKGAFTEAKSDRKGAFLEAHKGTLFLDEIQVASMQVQQSLLRAISLRKIKPLGSDHDIAVDVRVIAATNVDLRHLIEAKIFREDLYFRLNVITIHTPPLRDHKENLLFLTMHFLKEAERITGKSNLTLSKGALERMKIYDWPGNIRELRNCLTRAAVMSEDNIIHADELLIEPDTPEEEQSDIVAHGEYCRISQDHSYKTAKQHQGYFFSSMEDTSIVETKTIEAPQYAMAPHKREQRIPQKSMSTHAQSVVSMAKAELFAQLNTRQQKAWPHIVVKKSVTRGEYEQLIGKGVSTRTANYDLQDFVAKGLLLKKGRGPSTRYVVAN